MRDKGANCDNQHVVRSRERHIQDERGRWGAQGRGIEGGPPRASDVSLDLTLMIASYGRSEMKLWEALAIGFGSWPGFWSRAHYEKLPFRSCHQNQMIARSERHSDRYAISEPRPSTRDTNVVVSLHLRRRRQDQIRTSPLAEHALDQCEEAFEHSDWQKFGYWHSVFLHERNWLNPATRSHRSQELPMARVRAPAKPPFRLIYLFEVLSIADA